jgi:hypothetical protein
MIVEIKIVISLIFVFTINYIKIIDKKSNLEYNLISEKQVLGLDAYHMVGIIIHVIMMFFLFN